MTKITKRESNYISSMVKYGWKIERVFTGKNLDGYAWHGDCLLKVKIGRVLEGLIAKGFVEPVFIRDKNLPSWYRPTAKLLNLRCRFCTQGYLYDERDNKSADCSICETTGIDFKNR